MGLVFESSFLDSVLFIGLLLFYIHGRIKKKYRYFEEKGLPYIKPVYLLGSNFNSLRRKEPMTVTYQRLYDELKGKRLGGFFQFISPVILLRDPVIVNKFLVQDFSHYQDHGIQVDEKTNPLEGNLFNLNGGKWRALRRKLAPVFTSGKLKWMHDQVGKCANDFVKSLATEKELNIKEAAEGFTVEVIATCAFGMTSEAIRDSNSPFRVMGTKIFKPSLRRIIRMICRFAVPSVFFKLKIKTIPQEIEDFFSNLLIAAFEHRKKTGETRADFVQLLLELKEKGEVQMDPRDVNEDQQQVVPVTYRDKIDITDKLLTAQAFVFFTAGFETSATTLSFLVYLLAKHSEAQERARKEVVHVMKKHGGLTYDAMKEMTYLDACVSETLRMYPPAEVIIRICTKNHVLRDGLEIEKGVRVFVPVGALHRDPELHPEPQKFKPERFMDGNSPQPGSYLPFGDGPRICIARRFALMEVKQAAAEILAAFKLFPSPKTTEPLKIQTKGLALTSVEGGLWVKIVPLDGIQE